ncbi:AzlD domain-containing protein [Streptomyces sp. NPDC007896]|uniref:AzlD domain-containing protein n=1 Tax=unclassified Streptomyces TaxID=2593676 RepID=UPI0036E8D3F8
MNDPTQLVGAMLTLAAGTFALRLAGPLLRTRINIQPRAEQVLETSAVVLLTALVATTTLFEGHGFAGVARPVGVLVAGVLAWRQAPFLVVILAAACTTAVLRLLGIS